MTVLPARPILIDSPSTPPPEAGAYLHREEIVSDFGKALLKELNVSEGKVRKATKFESPEQGRSQFRPISTTSQHNAVVPR